MKKIEIDAGEQEVFVVLRIRRDQRRLYQIDSSERKGSAQLSEIKTPAKEIVLKEIGKN